MRSLALAVALAKTRGLTDEEVRNVVTNALAIAAQVAR